MSFAHSLRVIISVSANQHLCTAEVQHLLQLQQAWQHIHALRNRVHNHFRRHAIARANEQDEKHIGCHVAVSEDPGKKQHGSLRSETGPLAQARNAMG